MEKLRSLILDCGVAARAQAGESESGDRHLVKRFRNGALVAAVDGLGHGADAARAACMAAATLERYADESVIPLLQRCHAELAGTRGAVMSLAKFNWRDRTVTCLGVGNVEGFLLHSGAGSGPEQEALVLRGGVVGHQLPPLRASVFPVSAGDTLIFATDGIRSGFTEGLILSDPASKIATRILALYTKGTDDALVLVARCVERAA
ncbi:MAG TPA: SpoIIE family protein phosphatase [Terriglobia bacterium]|nr:SpoIIE family protein phosphatase [Terriglobia bacterium]